MDNKKYRLIGVCNPLDIVPFMVKPVFEDQDGNLYIGYIYDKETKEYTPYIQGFSRMASEYAKYVEKLSDCMLNSDALDKEFYEVGDLSPCGIEINDGIVYIGEMDKYLEFLREYKNEIAFSFEFSGNLVKNIEDEIMFIEPLVNIYKKDVYKNSLETKKQVEEFEKRLIKKINNIE